MPTNKDEKGPVFELPDDDKIPCLKCKWGLLNYLANSCVKFKMKPGSVYYDNQECEHFEPIKK